MTKQTARLWDSLWAEGISKENLARRREEDLQELEILEQKKLEEKKNIREG